MKKIILLILTLLTFIFANTGMLTPNEESGMGGWLSYQIATLDSDDEDFEGTYNIKFDYMTSLGLEVGLNKGDGWKGLELGYHYKSENWNAMLSWSRKLYDDFDGGDTDYLWVTGYSDTAIYGSLGGWSVDGGDFEFELIELGKIWTLEMGASLGISYLASFSSDDGIDKGILSLDLGYAF